MYFKISQWSVEKIFKGILEWAATTSYKKKKKTFKKNVLKVRDTALIKGEENVPQIQWRIGKTS